MRLQILSDLHLEFPKAALTFKFQRAPNIDALILAGDVHAHLGIFTLREELRAFDDVPIYYVPGNHEYYGQDFHNARAEALDTWITIRPQFPNLFYMDDYTAKLNDHLILGGTLWTDVENGDWFATKHLRSSMTDFAGAIFNGLGQHYEPKLFHPNDSLGQHKVTLGYFKMVLEEYPNLPAIVATHHLPHPICVRPKYKDSPLNPGFVSDLSHLFDPANNIKLWVHGHTHDTVDETVNGTRIVCNPRGYPDCLNPDFDPVFTVTV